MRLSCTAAILLLAVAIGAPAAADDVVLTNGKSFDGVIAQVDGDVVHIQLPYGGEITLSMSRVARIDRSESPFARYRAKKRELEAKDGATAAEWLALGRWARDEGFELGYRDAALVAARVDPREPAVAPVLRELGFALDDRLGEWVPRDEALARQGLVRFRGGWVSAEERGDRVLRDEAEQARALNASERLDRLTELVEAATALELAWRSAQPAPPQVVLAPSSLGVPVFIAPHRHPRRGPESPPPGREPVPPARDRPAPAAHETTFEGSFGGTLGPPELIPGRLNPNAAPPPGRLANDGGRR